MSSKSDGTQYDPTPMNNSSVKTDSSIGLRDQSGSNNKDDIDRIRLNNCGVENNTNPLATFSQPQTSRSCQIGENKNVVIKTLFLATFVSSLFSPGVATFSE